MDNKVRTGEMKVLLTALLTAQWFSSTADSFLIFSGNAIWLPILLAGLTLLGLCVVFTRIAPDQGLLSVCRQDLRLKPFALLIALLYLLLAATALRDTLTMLERYLLLRTPRILVLLLLLPLLILTAFSGLTGTARALRLTAPLLLALYVLSLGLSVWRQADFSHFFPILGNGVQGLFRTYAQALSVVAWLPILWLGKREQNVRRNVGLWACLGAGGLTLIGYTAYVLLFPNGLSSDMDFPLLRLCSSGGFSHSFQRTNALFVFVWLPVQLTAVSIGLHYCLRSLHAVFPARPGVLLPVPLLLIALLSLNDIDHSPQWVNLLLRTNLQALLLLPLPVPLLIGFFQERRKKRAQPSS